MKDDPMIRTACVIFLVIFLFLLSLATLLCASECQYGSVHAWFRTSEGAWQNATAHPLLRRGETFEVKITVTISTDLNVMYLKLHEFGTPVYEVITGPTMMEQLLEQRNPSLSEQSWTYQWKIRVRENTSWVNAYGPLEVYVQFNKNDADTSRVNFDIITAYILDELSEEYLPETDLNYSKEQPPSSRATSESIAVILVGFALAVVLRMTLKK
ncbi:MAG: sarcinarray family MAST domain-containing protein [Candidatus Thermoplasmatota archaeon]|nr:sarcinarray family MAST domain-containing protein [Candidatus Thermoplasmatota archaeon]